MTRRQRRILKVKLLLEAEQADAANGLGITIKSVLAAKVPGVGEDGLGEALEAMDRLAETLEGEDDGPDEVPRLREGDL